MKNAVLLFTGFFIISAVYAQTKPDALAEYRRNNFEQAVLICRDEIALDSRNLDSYVVMCWSLLRLNRYEETLRYALIARDINRYDARVVEILGEAYYFQGNNSEALRYFREYVNTAPSGPRIENVYYYIGEIYIRMGRFHHADIALTTAVHWMPNNAQWWTRLAFARENAGSLTDAVTAYEKALSLYPQMSDARRGLDRVIARMENR